MVQKKKRKSFSREVFLHFLVWRHTCELSFRMKSYQSLIYALPASWQSDCATLAVVQTHCCKTGFTILPIQHRNYNLQYYPSKAGMIMKKKKLYCVCDLTQTCSGKFSTHRFSQAVHGMFDGERAVNDQDKTKRKPLSYTRQNLHVRVGWTWVACCLPGGGFPCRPSCSAWVLGGESSTSRCRTVSKSKLRSCCHLADSGVPAAGPSTLPLVTILLLHRL